MPLFTFRFPLSIYHFLLFFVLSSACNAQPSPHADLTLPDGSLLRDKGKPNLILAVGQSTCPACQIDHFALERFYKRWAAKGFEVVYVSIDKEAEDFAAFYAEDPWETQHDSLRWDGVLVTELKLIGTPTLYAFDKNMNLLKEAENAHQMHYWLVDNYK